MGSRWPTPGAVARLPPPTACASSCPCAPWHAGPNPKYFGIGRGVTYYNLVSDQFTGLHGITVPGTLRDSLVLLAVVLRTADGVAADPDHDRHRCLLGCCVRPIPLARLPLQSAARRHRRYALLAHRSPCRLRHTQQLGAAMRQAR